MASANNYSVNEWHEKTISKVSKGITLEDIPEYINLLKDSLMLTQNDQFKKVSDLIQQMANDCDEKGLFRTITLEDEKSSNVAIFHCVKDRGGTITVAYSLNRITYEMENGQIDTGLGHLPTYQTLAAQKRMNFHGFQKDFNGRALQEKSIENENLNEPISEPGIPYSRGKIRGVKVNIAVVGKTGVGKSSWINHFRGITDRRHPKFAEVGSLPCAVTDESKAYEFAENPNLKLWDIPGANTANSPIKSYAKDNKMHLFDAFVFITNGRFDDTELSIADTIIKSMETRKRPYPFFLFAKKDGKEETYKTISKKFFFVRTMIDKDIENEAMQFAREGYDAPEIVAKLETFSNKMRDNYLNVQIVQNERLKNVVKDIYLVTDNLCRNMYGWKPDNEKLKANILKSLNHLQKTALSLAMFPSSEEKVEEKGKEIQWWIYGSTISSGAGGLIPFPGVSLAIDSAIVTSNVMHQLAALGIDRYSLEIRTMGHKNRAWTKKEFLEEVRKETDLDDDLLLAWLPNIFLSSADEMTGAISRLLILVPALANFVVVQSAEEFLKATVVGVVPGIIFGIGASASITYLLLTRLLQVNKKIAKAVIQVLGANVEDDLNMETD